jgi:leucyl-tRNA---protein transferase
VVRQYLVYDALDTCPYLPDRLARFPLRVSERRLRREELDAALAEGDRRQGVFLYRPSCPAFASTSKPSSRRPRSDACSRTAIVS